MNDDRHIEELRDMLVSLKHDAEWLYRYGDPGHSIGRFNQLTEHDQKRLLCLALVYGDEDVQNVARYLLRRLDGTADSLEQLLTEMSPEDQAQLAAPVRKTELTESDHERISPELQKGITAIGSLPVEEAFWILIPEDPVQDAIWIEAVGAKEEIVSQVRLPFKVIFAVSTKEQQALMSAMRKALWILHIHNHPTLPGYITSCGPSADDMGFASHWKSVRPELADRMMFFIVRGTCIVRYS